MDPAGISQVKLIDATPIGINVRSTAATYANVHDELRKVFAKTADAKNMGYKAGDFSYNTGSFAAPYVTAPAGQPGRTVSARCGHSMPGVQRFQIFQRGISY